MTTETDDMNERDCSRFEFKVPDNKVRVANMGPTWVLAAPGGPHVGPMNLAIRGNLWADILYCTTIQHSCITHYIATNDNGLAGIESVAITNKCIMETMDTVIR